MELQAIIFLAIPLIAFIILAIITTIIVLTLFRYFKPISGLAFFKSKLTSFVHGTPIPDKYTADNILAYFNHNFEIESFSIWGHRYTTIKFFKDHNKKEPVLVSEAYFKLSRPYENYLMFKIGKDIFNIMFQNGHNVIISKGKVIASFDYPEPNLKLCKGEIKMHDGKIITFSCQTSCIRHYLLPWDYWLRFAEIDILFGNKKVLKTKLSDIKVTYNHSFIYSIPSTYCSETSRDNPNTPMFEVEDEASLQPEQISAIIAFYLYIFSNDVIRSISNSFKL